MGDEKLKTANSDIVSCQQQITSKDYISIEEKGGMCCKASSNKAEY